MTAGNFRVQKRATQVSKTLYSFKVHWVKENRSGVAKQGVYKEPQDTCHFYSVNLKKREFK
jgi:hypothetical protein